MATIENRSCCASANRSKISGGAADPSHAARSACSDSTTPAMSFSYPVIHQSCLAGFRACRGNRERREA
ncbi:hypothetical protein [Nocardia xishanensis]|uniref:hypothetical protein n=1 Tax=Nocardia xishanensis TaxID=238964 RepID=UPI0034176217